MLYREALIQAIEHWNSDPIKDEWFFETFRSEFIGKMSSAEAFLSINLTIDFLINEKDESTACEILQTIIDLAGKSQTTEVPTGLAEHKDAIQNQFMIWGDYAQAKLKELFKYYRFN